MAFFSGESENRCFVRMALASGCSAAILMTGCVRSMGPPTVARDRFDYVMAISESWKRQTLLNLLKVRYSDAPVFMDVTSVINSYSVEGEIALNSQLGFGGGKAGQDFASVGGTGRYADRPTITYVPLVGERMSRGLIAPLPISSVLFLLQAGYPADQVLRVLVSSANGLQNEFGGLATRSGDRHFAELLTSVRAIQVGGALGLRIRDRGQEQQVEIYFPPSTDEAIASEIRTVQRLLGLDPKAKEYRVAYGAIPGENMDIAIISRSMMQVLTDYASYVEVPPEDIAQGRVFTPERSPERSKLFPPLINVHYASSEPDRVFAAIQYRGKWFWIEDEDFFSKKQFNFLILMFSLTETASAQSAPIITVPTR